MRAVLLGGPQDGLIREVPDGIPAIEVLVPTPQALVENETAHFVEEDDPAPIPHLTLNYRLTHRQSRSEISEGCWIYAFVPERKI